MIAALAWLVRLARTAWFTVGMALFLFGCVAFQYHPRTPLGTQCPTATVQVVKVPIVCCGKVTGYEVRAPKPGEGQFVQCQCAEKKSADHKLSVPPKLEAFVQTVVEVQTRAFTVPQPPIVEKLSTILSIDREPLVPPPLTV